MLKNDNCYIRKRYNGKFIISKSIDGCQTHCGTFDSLEEAQRVRDYFIENNWSLEVINCFKRVKPFEDRYIRRNTHNRNRILTYTIQKAIDGRVFDFGTFKTIRAAREERDLLEKYNWDYDLLIGCE